MTSHTDSASPHESSACAGQPNLPALIERLPDDDTRKPQVEFTSEVRRVFLEALSVVGSVRSAAKRARVSHQTVYRARRACPAFRRCWDAALLHALPRAEDVLATRAIDGVEETVFYHGEEVAKRRRYDPRLLLAHIGRLDRLAARSDVAALADDFDDALDALAAGEDLPETPGEELSPGQCNTRSMSPPAEGREGGQGGPVRPALELECDCPTGRYLGGALRGHWRWGSQGPEPVPNVDGNGPCCEAPSWPDCRDCPHFPRYEREEEEEREAAEAAKEREEREREAALKAQIRESKRSSNRGGGAEARVTARPQGPDRAKRGRNSPEEDNDSSPSGSTKTRAEGEGKRPPAAKRPSGRESDDSLRAAGPPAPVASPAEPAPRCRVLC